MAASAARIAANQTNARKSTGPKTSEGKARSRANAVKHGLTGAGVALPTENAAMVKLRFLGLQEEMAPSDLAGRLLVHKIALMSVRVERASRQEAAALSLRVRHAAEEFELDRLAEVDRIFEAIETDPGSIRRRLLTSPEGVDKLLGAVGAVKAQLLSGYFRSWAGDTRARIEAFFGGTGSLFPLSRTYALMKVMAGDCRWVGPEELDAIPERAARQDWARDEMLTLVDAELAKLATIRGSIDPEMLRLDRLEAGERALFDPGSEAVLARKYEAAATRGFFRALREFHQNEANLAKAEAEPMADTIPFPSAPQSSNEPNDDLDETLTASEQEIVHDVDSEDDPLQASVKPGRNEPNLEVKSSTAVRQNEPTPARPADPSPARWSPDRDRFPSGPDGPRSIPSYHN